MSSKEQIIGVLQEQEATAAEVRHECGTSIGWAYNEGTFTLLIRPNKVAFLFGSLKNKSAVN